MKYYVDDQGKYLGGWDANPPAGAIEVPEAPDDARQVWNFQTSTWGAVPVTVPQAISALNGLLTLDEAGLSAAYQSWVEAPERTFAQKAFIEKAMTWRRNDPVVLAAAEALQLTSEQVDALFILAGEKE